MMILSFFQIVLGLLFTLFIPGFLLNLILFKEQDWLERIILSFTLSICITVLFGLFLGSNQLIRSFTGGITAVNSWIGLISISFLLGSILIKKRFKSGQYPFKKILNLRSYFNLNNLFNHNTQATILFLTSMLISVLILLYISLLRLLNLPSWIFHILYFLNILVITYLVFSKKLSTKASLFLIIFYLISLQLIVPLRQPIGVISTYPDMVYEHQLIEFIKSTSSFSFNFPTTGEAISYKFNPSLELVISELSLTTSIPSPFLIKFIFILFNSLTLLFLFLFYKKFIGGTAAVMSTLIAGSCFWFIHFQAFTNHQSLALLFFSSFLFCSTQQENNYKFCSILSLIFIILSHHFSSLLIPLILIIAYLVYLVILKFNFNLPSFFINKSVVIVFIALSLVWLLFYTPYLLGDLSNITKTAQHLSVSSVIFLEQNLKTEEYPKIELNNSLSLEGDNPSIVNNSSLVEPKFVLLPSNQEHKSLMIKGLAYLGVLLFGLLSTLGLILILTKRVDSFTYFVPLSMASLSISLIFTLLWSLGFYKTAILDLFNRQFIYCYFFLSPCLIYFITTIYPKRKILSYSLFFLILISSVYQGTPYFFYNSQSIKTTLQDVRLYSIQTESLIYFIKTQSIESNLWTLNLLSQYIGATTAREVASFSKSFPLSIAKDQLSQNEIIILGRTNLFRLTNSQEILSVVQDNDLIFSIPHFWLVKISK